MDSKQVDAAVNEIAERWNQSSSFIRSSDCTEYSDDARTDYYDKDGKAVRFVQENDGDTFTYLFGDDEKLIYIYERDSEGQTFHYFYQDGSLICYRSGMGRNYAPFEADVQKNAEEYYQNGMSLLSDRLMDRKEEEDKKDEDDGEDLIEGNPEDYILPESNKRLLTEEDLKGLSSEQLRLARNEIFARHGRIFGSSDLQDYFESKPWYKGTADADDFQDSSLSEIESKNVEFILEHE
ncbi:YARHG domain-containing protein [Mediterraneibacter glycyrrhizinilyticus]|nr:YARHG domain-containing protein [Mediterraneibacter glycyrrhizinilyticus]